MRTSPRPTSNSQNFSPAGSHNLSANPIPLPGSTIVYFSSSSNLKKQGQYHQNIFTSAHSFNCTLWEPNLKWHLMTSTQIQRRQKTVTLGSSTSAESPSVGGSECLGDPNIHFDFHWSFLLPEGFLPEAKTKTTSRNAKPLASCGYSRWTSTSNAYGTADRR